MMWADVAMIMFSSVMMIHMGLVDAILDVLGMRDRHVPVVTCPKCSTWWLSIAYMIATGHDVILSVATSFLASYCAIWFDLLLGQMDVWYEYIYKRINECPKADDTVVHNKNNGKRKGKDSSLSKV